MCRKYSDYDSAETCAVTILKECALNGKSGDWSGTLDDLDKIEKICEKFGVAYVDDFHGIWKPTHK